MFDDDDLKVRRNLVLASSLVIATNMLGVPVAEILAPALKLDPASTTPPVLAMTLAVLAYLTLRYWYIELESVPGNETETERLTRRYVDIIDSHLPEITARVVTFYVHQWIRVFNRTGFLPHFLKQRFEPELATFQEEFLKDRNRATMMLNRQLPVMRIEDFGRPLVTVKSASTHDKSVMREWHLNAIVQMKFKGQGTNANPMQINCTLSYWHAIPLFIYSRLWSGLCSESAVRAGIPVFLGATAIALTFLRVMQLYGVAH